MLGVHRSKLAISTTSLGPCPTIEQIIAESRRVGFVLVEPTFGPDGYFATDSPETALRDFAERLHAAGLGSSALFLEESSVTALVADGPLGRSAADSIRAGLRAAMHMGTDTVILTLAAPAEQADQQPTAAGEMSRQCMLEALLELRFDAQRCAVHLAVRPASNRPLPSPQESRDLLDRINSPWVGFCLDSGRPGTEGDAVDWIETLGHRLRSVRFAFTHDADLRPALAALRRAGYSAPITCLSAADDLADVVSKTREAMA